jgi:gamma-glutamylcyclotransferase (GGCT)/AIG2-like uncharacterized protein YtfP
MVSVFVYGTLKPGYSNHRCCCDLVLSAEAAMVRGVLFHLPVGYPAMTFGDCWVKGVRLVFPDAQILTILDRLEDYCPHRHEAENEYQRVWTDMFNRNEQPLGQGWIYLMDCDRIQRYGGRLVQSGEWSEARA